MCNALWRIALSAALLLTTSSLVQAGGNPPSAATESALVTGTISYRERIALPDDAVILVQLRDVSLMDVAAKLISEQRIRPQHSVPIAFALPYNPADIDERMTYSVFASIRSGDRLLFISDRSYAVLTRGQSNQVDLILVQP